MIDDHTIEGETGSNTDILLNQLVCMYFESSYIRDSVRKLFTSLGEDITKTGVEEFVELIERAWNIMYLLDTGAVNCVNGKISPNKPLDAS